MKELMKKLATRKGVKNFECFFFWKTGPHALYQRTDS